jgi:lysophospholipase L1-like esterase
LSVRSLLPRPRVAVLVAGLAATALVGSAIAAGPALASARPNATPAAGTVYLALGDSIGFGYEEPTAVPAPNYLNAASLVGYPEDVASDLNLQVANAACPGETTTSYLKAGVPSNGCENSPDAQGGDTGPGYREGYLLHESYAGTQSAYAKSFLKSHPQTGLITLQLGANDGLLCQETTADQCQSEQGTVVNKIIANVTTILKQLRNTDHYSGPIVLVTYYSEDYGNALDNANSQAVNYALTLKAAKYNATVADGYGAFQTATEAQGTESPCTAGLLVPLSGGGCGIHPTAAGQAVLAQAVETALANS